MSQDATTRLVRVNGAMLLVEEHGQGSSLVLLHGGLGSSASMAPLIPDLADRLRVITPDLRGHGRSTNPSGTLSYPQLADDIATLILELGLSQPVVAGGATAGRSRSSSRPATRTRRQQ